MATVNQVLYYVVFYNDRNSRHTTRYYLTEEEANNMMTNLVQKQGFKNASVVKVQRFVEVKDEQNK